MGHCWQVSIADQQCVTTSTPEGSAGVFVPEEAPQWLCELGFRGANIVYGPWADRHRYFMVLHYYPWDYEPQLVYIPKAGTPRRCAAFSVRMNFLDAATMRIPFREPSKNSYVGCYCFSDSLVVNLGCLVLFILVV